jgi:DeoR/GlpR family transcriptional regulator of sugar metabolism
MDRRIARILELLNAKQMTAKELSQTMHVSHDTARDYLSILHEQQRVYVAAWQPV